MKNWNYDLAKLVYILLHEWKLIYIQNIYVELQLSHYFYFLLIT